MKYLAIMITVLMAALTAHAQKAITLDGNTIIPAYNLDITWHKTTLLIFPAPIKDADRGDKYILAETVPDVNNILKVKAGQKGFPQSNLQVVTTDGRVYSFVVNYSENAPSLPVDLGKQPPYAPITFKGVSLNSKELDHFAGLVAGSYPFLNKKPYRKHGIEFRLDGIYVKNDVLFFQYRLRNIKQISYQEASLRFYVRDKKSIKRTASQDKEIMPLYIKQTGLPEDEKGRTIVVAFPKFTISELKYLSAEMMEQDGDRNPVIRLDQGTLFKARALR